jgi:myo-inositol 2-dehydrogenase/D-chiro-inositol 1-dehydrogenase
MNGSKQIGRRAFLGAAGGLMVVRPELVRGSKVNSAVRIGLLGCGLRGVPVAEGLKTHGARIVALADLFEDQLAAARKRLNPTQLFQGPRAFEEIAASKEIDALVIATPPYLHPEHLAAAVEAGKHVYCEKPVAVDVAGANRVIEIGERAKGRLSLDVGFQLREAPPFVEIVRRIHAGALGEIACAEAHYFAAALDRPPAPEAPPEERRIRNWFLYRDLSGDVILEQNIHVIDICNWVLKGHPVKAVGRCGRQGRSDEGDASSHFSVSFTYPNDVHVTFSSTQFGKGGFDVNERFFGPRGSSTSPYTGPVQIFGEEAWSWGGSERPSNGEFSASGAFTGNLTRADPEKQKAFLTSITSGNFHNQAASGAESALSAMLGRAAAYTGREVAWDDLVSGVSL